MSNLFGGGGVDMPSRQAEQAKRTATPVKQLSEDAKRNRRKAASLLTRTWSEPMLGAKEMLG